MKKHYTFHILFLGLMILLACRKEYENYSEELKTDFMKEAKSYFYENLRKNLPNNGMQKGFKTSAKAIDTKFILIGKEPTKVKQLTMIL
jgi:hypothetical protein